MRHRASWRYAHTRCSNIPPPQRQCKLVSNTVVLQPQGSGPFASYDQLPTTRAPVTLVLRSVKTISQLTGSGTIPAFAHSLAKRRPLENVSKALESFGDTPNKSFAAAQLQTN